MQLARIPKATIASNAAVVDTLRSAHDDTLAVKDALSSGSVSRDQLLARLASASDAAAQAVSGMHELGRINLLNDTFQRYAYHSVSQINQALDMLKRPGGLSPDGREIFASRVFDAEVATRLGVEAGDRSLSSPVRHPIGGARHESSSADGASSCSGPTWSDGEWLDSNGNPARGNGSSWGPDGGWGDGPDGSSRDSGGGFGGPDGDSDSGI